VTSRARLIYTKSNTLWTLNTLTVTNLYTMNRNLRGLGLSLNVPASPPLSPQQHPFVQTDDGYFYDESQHGETYMKDYVDANGDGNYHTESNTTDDVTIGNVDDNGNTIVHTTEAALVEAAVETEESDVDLHYPKPVIHPALVNALNQHTMNKTNPGSEVYGDTVMTINTNHNKNSSLSDLLPTSANLGEQEVLDQNSAGTKIGNDPKKNILMNKEVKEAPTVESMSIIKSVPQPMGIDKQVKETGDIESIPSLIENGGTQNTLNDVDDEIAPTINEIQLPSEVESIQSSHASNNQEQSIEHLSDGKFSPSDNFNHTSDTGNIPIIPNEEGELTDKEDEMKSGNETGEVKDETSLDNQWDERPDTHEEGGFTPKIKDMEENESSVMILDEENKGSNEEEIKEPVYEEVTENNDEAGKAMVLDNTSEFYTKHVELKDELMEITEINKMIEEIKPNGLQNEEHTLDVAKKGDALQDSNEEGPGNFKDFDENFSSKHIDIQKIEQPPDIYESQDIVNRTRQFNNEYTGDGFTYHIAQPKSSGHSYSVISITVIVSLLFFLTCFCCIRYKRRRYSKPSRGKYSPIDSEDFFNGTFSDEISFYGKDSDDDMSYSSDDEDNDVKIELGKIHEMEANGGLTLEEING
jgi:hypothetical protein